MSARYDTFVILAETLQWDEAAIDFAPDKAAWPTLGDTENAQRPRIDRGLLHRRVGGVRAPWFLPGRSLRRLGGGVLPRAGP